MYLFMDESVYMWVSWKVHMMTYRLLMTFWPMESKHCNTNGKSVWTVKVIMRVGWKVHNDYISTADDFFWPMGSKHCNTDGRSVRIAKETMRVGWKVHTMTSYLQLMTVLTNGIQAQQHWWKKCEDVVHSISFQTFLYRHLKLSWTLENSVCYCYTSYEMTDKVLWFQVQMNSYSSNWNTPY